MLLCSQACLLQLFLCICLCGKPRLGSVSVTEHLLNPPSVKCCESTSFLGRALEGSRECQVMDHLQTRGQDMESQRRYHPVAGTGTPPVSRALAPDPLLSTRLPGADYGEAHSLGRELSHAHSRSNKGQLFKLQGCRKPFHRDLMTCLHPKNNATTQNEPWSAPGGSWLH